MLQVTAVLAEKRAALRVALVDDQLLFAEALSKYLTEFHDCEVWIAVDAEGAERLVRERDIDVMLLDYHLPRVKGDALVRRLREIAPDLTIYVVTSDVTPEVREVCIAAGANDVVTKDRGLEAIVGTLARARA